MSISKIVTNSLGLGSETGAISIPVGTEAQRPGTPVAGMFRFNNDADQFEGYNGTLWGAVGGGNVDGGFAASVYLISQVINGGDANG